MKLVNDNLYHNLMVQDDFVEDFHALDVTSAWTDTSADSGASPALVTDGTCSGVALTTGATNNNECLLSTKRKWDVLANRPLTMECRAQFAEASTSAANYHVGFNTLGATADLLVDDGAGLTASSASGIAFYKVDGGTKWKVSCQVATTNYGSNTTNITSATATGLFASLRIEVRPLDAVFAEVVYLVDTNGGTDFHQCRDATSGLLVKHILTYTSYAAAYFALDVKDGSGTGEVFTIDLVKISQRK